MKREIYSTTLVIMIAILLLTSVIASQDTENSLVEVRSRNIDSATSLMSEKIQGNEDTNSADVQAVVSTNPTSVSNSNTVSDREYFTKELDLTGKIQIKQSVLEKLTQAKQREKIKVKRVLALARIVREEKREKTAEELLIIEKSFLQKLERHSTKNENSKENVKKQLENYVKIIEQKQEIKLNINDNKIKNLFKTANTEEFMNSLFYN
jgi:hypothetical protein|tara:strand:+ start:1891 stop:2517 length:627 start_codon:yes stop_codon:yes gene_type:complete